MIVEFLDEARQEFIEAALWYESIEPGLGKRFRNEVTYAVDRIGETPFLWEEREGGSSELPRFSLLHPLLRAWRENHSGCCRSRASPAWLLAIPSNFFNRVVNFLDPPTPSFPQN